MDRGRPAAMSAKQERFEVGLENAGETPAIRQVRYNRLGFSGGTGCTGGLSPGLVSQQEGIGVLIHG